MFVENKARESIVRRVSGTTALDQTFVIDLLFRAVSVTLFETV